MLRNAGKKQRRNYTMDHWPYYKINLSQSFFWMGFGIRFRPRPTLNILFMAGFMIFPPLIGHKSCPLIAFPPEHYRFLKLFWIVGCRHFDQFACLFKKVKWDIKQTFLFESSFDRIELTLRSLSQLILLWAV